MILLALQFWHGDADRAGQLAELILHSAPDADLLLFARYDCPEPDWVHRLGPRARFARSTRTGSGWPAGPNQLWFGLVEYLRDACRDGRLPRYDGVFTLEPDCVPVKRGWFDLLSTEWDAAGVDCLGAYMSGPDLAVAPHVNGNLVLRGSDEVLSAVAAQADQCPPTQPWDVWIYPLFTSRLHSAGSKLVFNCWHSSKIDPAAVDRWVREGFALIHGVRDDSCLRAAREILR